MQKQRQTLQLIISGRYSRSQLQNEQQPHALTERKKGHTIDRSEERSEEQEERLEKQEEEAKKIIEGKYRTFMKWDFRKSLPRNIRGGGLGRAGKVEQARPQMAVNFSAMMKFDEGNNKGKKKVINKEKSLSAPNNILKKESQKDSRLPQITPAQPQNEPILTSQMQAIKNDRRQRFKKLQNPLQFLKHYMQKQHFQPGVEQKHLIQKLISIQKTIDLQIATPNPNPNPSPSASPNGESSQAGLQDVLQNIYALMNLSVDYNELLFLALVVSLAADICYFLKDYPRAFYFYNQARIAGSYARNDRLKIPALMGLGRICFDLKYFEEAKRLFRKALQYAWRNSDEDTELEVYDCFGQVSNQKGKVRQSMYYHQKFAKNILEPPSSALKKISRQMLKDYDNHIESLEDSNLDSLFLEYIHLPLNKSFEVKAKTESIKKYKNYNEMGKSPRMSKESHDFSRQSFPDIEFQLKQLLVQDYEFKTEIPDPDKPGSRQLNRLFNKSRYDVPLDGNKKRQLDFIHSIEFNRIMKKKPEKPDIKKELKKPLDQQVQQMLKDRLDPKWYEQMVHEIKKRRVEKMGDLKEKVRNSHLSYGKYPSQRKRQAVWSTQKINQSFNRTLLDWIDPQS